MNTIPNLAPTMNAKPLTFEEVKKYVEVDDFVWVELRHSPYSVKGITLHEDETFMLCVETVYTKRSIDFLHSIDFRTPFGTLNCPYDEYNKTWRIWNLCPMRYNNEIWEDE